MTALCECGEKLNREKITFSSLTQYYHSIIPQPGRACFKRNDELKELHQATIEELNALKRWIYGRRRERVGLVGVGCAHLEPSNLGITLEICEIDVKTS